MINENLWLSRFAKLTVAAAFLLIFIGGLTTTTGAGMAFPDWPLSHGSVNPAGWWSNVMERLEHGHRLTAETVGLLVGILCAWIWRSKTAVPGAILASILLSIGAKLCGAPAPIIAHVGLWSSALVFVILLFTWRENPARPAILRWLGFAAFLGVLVQAVLGGLRVTVQAGGDVPHATALRIVHGCFAQIELALLVAVAALLSPVLTRVNPRPAVRRMTRFTWITAAVVSVQLIVGATMRHLGAGLAIPTFPSVPGGGWMLKIHSLYMDLNFTHTRFGALAVTIFILILVARLFANAHGDPLVTRPALLLVALLAAQIILGMFVIWHLRPPLITTLHVVTGASILATTVLLAVRTSRYGPPAAPRASTVSDLQEVHG